MSAAKSSAKGRLTILHIGPSCPGPEECPHDFEHELSSCQRCYGTGFIRSYSYLEKLCFFKRNGGVKAFVRGRKDKFNNEVVK